MTTDQVGMELTEEALIKAKEYLERDPMEGFCYWIELGGEGFCCSCWQSIGFMSSARGPAAQPHELGKCP